MWLAYHEQARAHAAPGSCTPAALTRSRTTSARCSRVQQLPEGVPLHVEGFVRAGGTFSGGTYPLGGQHHGPPAPGRARSRRERRRREGAPAGRQVKASTGAAAPRARAPAAGRCRRRPSTRRSCCARRAALDRYGPDFPTATTSSSSSCRWLAGWPLGAGALVALAQLPPTRKALLRLKSPGDGPSPEQREKALVQGPLRGEGGGQQVVCEVTGGDPGYGETSKMLAESALCLALDELPAHRRPGHPGAWRWATR